MRSNIKFLALVGLVAACMIVMPALSLPAGNGAKSAPCNASERANCYAMARGMPMGSLGMGPMEDCARGMGPAFMMHGKNASSWRNESHNTTRAVEIRQGGNGFAISGNEYHVLEMNVKGKIAPNSADMAKLISDNKTLAQIKSDIKAMINAEIAAASYNGSLHLGQSNYNLVNIKLDISKDNNTTIDADVAGPKLDPKDTPTTVVGHITLTASRHENSTIGAGILTMNSGGYSGKYSVLLEMGHGMGRDDGMQGHAFAGREKKDRHFGMNKEA